jgi:hypothetical protein
MKRLLFATALFSVCTLPSLQAQSLNAYANIPFDFRMGTKSMPAGRYNFKETGGVLQIKDATGKHSAFNLTLPASRGHAVLGPKVQFHRYGDQYFLANIFTEGSTEGRSVGVSKLEREVASRYSPVETASLDLKH